MKKWLVLAPTVVFIGGTLYGSYQWKQRHLSNGFRHILLVLFDPSNTNTDVHGYLHDARLAAKTAEDGRVLSQVETMIQLRVESIKKQQQANEGYEKVHQRWDLVNSTLATDEEQKQLHIYRTQLIREEIIIEKALSMPYDLLAQQSKELSYKANALEKSIRSGMKLPAEK